MRAKKQNNGCAIASETEEEKSQREYREKRWQVFRTDRSEIEKCALEISGRYDRWILTLSGATLAISLAYIEKIAAKPIEKTLILLGIAWFFLIVTMFSALIGVLLSQYGLHRQTEILDAEYRAFRDGSETGEPEKTVSKQNRPVWFANKLNWASVISFILGVGFLCRFAFVNLPREPLAFGAKISGTNIIVGVTNFVVPAGSLMKSSTNP